MLGVRRPLHRWPVVTAVAIAVVAAGGGTAWAMTHGSSSASGSRQVVAAKIADVTQTVSASGTLAAAHEADLGFDVSGRVTKVLVSTGDSVTKGQALARVASASLAATYASAKASLVAAQDTVSDDSSQSSTQQAADASQVTSAKAALTSARTALRDATLRATIAGTVTSLDLTVGEEVSSGSSTASAGDSGSTGSSGTDSTSTSSGTSSDVVIQSTSLLVDATVDDTVVKRVSAGQSVTITPEGATSTVSGVVASVSTLPSSSSGVVTFPVVVRVTGHPSDVYAGASATMVITTEKVGNVLEIPTEAISYAGSVATVELEQGGSTVKRTVTIGTAYGLESQVLTGLVAGDKVVVTTPTFPGRPSGGTQRRGGTSPEGGSSRNGSGSGTGESGGFGGGGFGGGS